MPWDWLLYRSIQMGCTATDFWRMSPRAVRLLMRCHQKSLEARLPRQARGRGRQLQPEQPKKKVRLNYIPR